MRLFLGRFLGKIRKTLKIGMNISWPDATMGVEDMVNEGVRRAYNDPDNKLRASVLSDPAGKLVVEKVATPDEFRAPLPRRVAPL